MNEIKFGVLYKTRTRPRTIMIITTITTTTIIIIMIIIIMINNLHRRISCTLGVCVCVHVRMMLIFVLSFFLFVFFLLKYESSVCFARRTDFSLVSSCASGNIHTTPTKSTACRLPGGREPQVRDKKVFLHYRQPKPVTARLTPILAPRRAVPRRARPTSNHPPLFPCLFLPPSPSSTFPLLSIALQTAVVV